MPLNKEQYVHCITVEPSIPDTIGPEESVLIREVSLFQRLKRTQTRYLGRKNVSCLERCPYFRGVLIEGFHCTSKGVYGKCTLYKYT